MRVSASEWEMCRTLDGKPLPRDKCEAYRSNMESAGISLRPMLPTPENVAAPRPVHNKISNPKSVQLPTLSVAVIIPCHNYGHWLSECLDSVLAQTVPAAEVLVIDDCSTDNTREVAESYAGRGVKYLRVEHGHVHRTRESGFNATTSPLLCFLDADDVLDAGYLAAAMPHFASPDVGIVTTGIHCFGEASDIRHYPEYPPSVRNWIHAASVVRRGALQLADAFGADLPCQSHADWYIWRRVQEYGFRVVRGDGIYRYRVHSGSMLQTAFREREPYRVQAALDLETVTLVLPLSGRREWLVRLQDWVQDQLWPLERLHIVVTDTGPDDWSREIRQWLAGVDCAGFTYLRFPDTHGLADENRAASKVAQAQVGVIVPRLFQRAFLHAVGEYIMSVEDDILPPLDAISRLMDSMAPDVAAVSGIYQGRFAYRYCINPQPKRFGSGVVNIDASGFGCLLLRKSAWQQTVLTNAARYEWYDWNYGLRIKELGWKYKLDWSVECLHQDLPANGDPVVPISRHRHATPATAPGPGDHLHALFLSIGIEPHVNCQCHLTANEMNKNGVEWCRKNRLLLANKLRGTAATYSWGQTLKATWHSIASGLAWSISPAEPFASLIDEACRKCEAGEPLAKSVVTSTVSQVEQGASNG